MNKEFDEFRLTSANHHKRTCLLILPHNHWNYKRNSDLLMYFVQKVEAER